MLSIKAISFLSLKMKGGDIIYWTYLRNKYNPGRQSGSSYDKGRTEAICSVHVILDHIAYGHPQDAEQQDVVYARPNQLGVVQCIHLDLKQCYFRSLYSISCIYLNAQ